MQCFVHKQRNIVAHFQPVKEHIHKLRLIQYLTQYKLCGRMLQYAPAPASWQHLRIYSSGGRAVPACWLLRHQHQADLWPFDLESGVRVMCDVGYLCANFSLPRPLCSRFRPDVRNRQTSDEHHRLMSLTIRDKGIKSSSLWYKLK